MSGATGRLYLDQLQALGVEGSGESRGYPPIDRTIAAVLKVVALNLFITESSLQWAFYDAVCGKSDSFRTIRERLLSPPVRMVTK